MAVLVPQPMATEVDGLRRGFGDRAIARIPPHITLVPPLNVAETSLFEALSVLRTAASEMSPFVISIGPPETFLPRNPVVYLRVEAGDELVWLRDAVRLGSLDREDPRPFVPHVTIASGTLPGRISATMEAMADFKLGVPIERLHLLEMIPDAELGTRWVPIADYPFEPRRVVGRGGIELELTRSTILDPEATEFERLELADDLGGQPSQSDGPQANGSHMALATPPYATSTVSSDVVVTARRRSVGVVGVARGTMSGSVGHLQSILVAESVRRQGIGGHLLAAFNHLCEETAAPQ